MAASCAIARASGAPAVTPRDRMPELSGMAGYRPYRHTGCRPDTGALPQNSPTLQNSACLLKKAFLKIHEALSTCIDGRFAGGGGSAVGGAVPLRAVSWARRSLRTLFRPMRSAREIARLLIPAGPASRPRAKAPRGYAICATSLGHRGRVSHSASSTRAARRAGRPPTRRRRSGSPAHARAVGAWCRGARDAIAAASAIIASPGVGSARRGRGASGTCVLSASDRYAARLRSSGAASS